jgi:lysozyme family protein
MADYKVIIPFIRKAEGGYVNDPDDAGGETNAGITYNVWKTFFGDTHDRFLKMSTTGKPYLKKDSGIKCWAIILHPRG